MTFAFYEETLSRIRHRSGNTRIGTETMRINSRYIKPASGIKRKKVGIRGKHIAGSDPLAGKAIKGILDAHNIKAEVGIAGEGLEVKSDQILLIPEEWHTDNAGRIISPEELEDVQHVLLFKPEAEEAANNILKALDSLKKLR